MNRPIFIVGCPRSGTGIFHQLVRLHPQVAWITPFTNAVCGKPWFRRISPPAAWPVEWVLHRLPNAALPPLLRGPYDGSLGLSSVFETHEGHAIWDQALPPAEDHRATAEDVTEDVRTYLRDVVQWHRRYHDRPRLVWKTPKNAFRLRFLRALFPQARIVHLIRDGRAVAASILKRRRASGRLHQWWGVRPPGWQSVQSAPPIEQAAWTWQQCIGQIRTDIARFPDEHCLEVHYESFLDAPGRVLRRVFSTAALSPEGFFTEQNRRHLTKVRPPQTTWRTRLRAEQIEHLEEAIAPTLRECGYDDLATPR
ncbi:sulfotransferase family protein [Salinibacter altiplanensis]|uniref:sulfotransferase family protein n=1 Tax=Salinibacter altiplanensis TaxID=1803181 RepID=UPI000C9F3AF2|nr:sulfotransferase [Salinibacter altiplanensis]